MAVIAYGRATELPDFSVDFERPSGGQDGDPPVARPATAPDLDRDERAA